MNKKFYQVIAEIGKVETMESGLKMVVYTNEVVPEEEAILLWLRKKQGHLLFAPIEHEFTEEELNLPEVKVESGEKTPGQRLRAVLFRIWENQGGTSRQDKKTFEQYYREQMERIINKAKEQLWNINQS